jgi:hypothetical protein
MHKRSEALVGRPRIAIDPSLLGGLLAAGQDYESIACSFGTSERTITRRVAELRARFGRAWGRSIIPPKPAGTQRVPVDVDGGELDHAELQALARSTLESIMRGTYDPKLAASAVAAARAVLSVPEPLPDVPTPKVDRAVLLEKAKQASQTAGRSRAAAQVLELRRDAASDA